ncbi:MAG: 50S ribosomal protein L23 [Candidatus Micrarchaeota archaeon]|nr:50S ribosomal protein L23 [Candidatus Micrarchaeota archaeon]
MDALMYPIATEKAINMIERNNVVTYMVDIRANKTQIKKEFESVFKVKVERINTEIEPRNRKRAYIKLNGQFKASDIALKLKLV